MTARGFTLFEIVVAMTLLAMATAVGTAALTRPSEEARGSWRVQVARDLHQAVTTGAIARGFADSVGSYTAYPTGEVIYSRQATEVRVDGR